ncbi:MAG: hypothetical protein EON59_08500 [Alphaproteobacteria bacterium]|nr:MAG: hypothetical protein EON59_08500 [Alphaproteobacteria bacterium]
MKTWATIQAGDYCNREILRRQKLAARAARRLGLVSIKTVKSKDPELPPNLCQHVVARERLLSQKAVKLFYKAQKDGTKVFFVTIIRPEWTRRSRDLKASIVKEVRDWTSRRARALAKHGQQRVLGFVDVAWDDRSAVNEPSRWSVHVHLIVCVEAKRQKSAESWIRSAFNAIDPSGIIHTPVKVKRLKRDTDIMRASEYASRALLMDKLPHRRTYRDDLGERKVRKQTLPAKFDKELSSMVHILGPKAFWVLSGFRRQGDAIVLHDAKSGAG